MLFLAVADLLGKIGLGACGIARCFTYASCAKNNRLPLFLWGSGLSPEKAVRGARHSRLTKWRSLGKAAKLRPPPRLGSPAPVPTLIPSTRVRSHLGKAPQIIPQPSLAAPVRVL